MYYCAKCQALALTNKKNIHFMKLNWTYDLKMSKKTALKRFPKEWNHFLIQIFMVLTLHFFCSITYRCRSYIIGFAARQSYSQAKNKVDS